MTNLPELGLTSAGIEDGKLDLGWTVANGSNANIRKMTVYAVTDSSRTYIGEIDSDDIAGQDGSSGTAALDIPADMMSGEYTIEVDATLGDSLVDIVTYERTVTYTNPDQPDDPVIGSVTNAGDYRLRVTESSSDDFDAYQVTIYRKNAEGTLEPVNGGSGALMDKGSELVVGGRLEIPEDEKTPFTEEDLKELAARGAYEDGGKLYAGLQPGERYTVGVRKVKYLYAPETPEADKVPEKAVAVVMSNEVYKEASAPLTTPQEPKVTITVPGAKPISVEGRKLNIEATVPTVTSTDVTVNVTSDMPIQGTWYLDDLSYEAAKQKGTLDLGRSFNISLKDLETQEHTLVLEGVNGQGDGFTVTFHFAVDALAPVLQLLSPASGAVTEKNDTIQISGRTDPGVTVRVEVNDTAVTKEVGDDGTFAFTVDADKSVMKNTVRVRVTDEAGNTLERVFSVYNYRVNDLEGIRIYRNGADITGTQLDTGSATPAVALTLMGVTEKGAETFRINDDSLVEWTLTPVESSSGLTNGVFSADQYSQGMVTATLSMTDGIKRSDEALALTDADASAMSAVFSYGLTASEEKPTYQVVCTCLNPVHSTAWATPSSARPGDLVTVTVAMESGFKATLASVPELEITDNGFTEGNVQTFTFTMPDKSVQVTASLVSTVRYEIKAAPAANGTVEIAPATAYAGDAVTVTAKPDDGYVLYAIEAATDSGEKAPLTRNADGTFTLVVPEGDVTVTATFVLREDLQFKLETSTLEDAFANYPDEIRSLYGTAEEMTRTLEAQLQAVVTATEAESATYDVKLFYRINNDEWTEATAENFPAQGVTVTLTYPDAVKDSWQDYDFTLLHLIVDPLNTGKTAGEIEQMSVTATQEGITFTADCLSPFLLGWAKKPASNAGGYYRVTIPAVSGGSVVSDKAGTGARQKVTLTVTPDFLQQLKSLKLVDRYGNEVPYTDNGDGTVTFKMPHSNVRVVAEFEHLCPSLDYPDLDVGAWYHDYADYVIATGLMHGVGNWLFEPNGTVTRAQMVTVLWNMRGDPVVDFAIDYDDVSESAWYAEAIRWATSEGIAGGYGGGKFGPNDAITREQMATMLYRFEQKYGEAAVDGQYELPFADAATVSSWAREAVSWCSMEGILTGKEDNRFDPSGSTRRSEMAATFTRYLKKTVK